VFRVIPLLRSSFAADLSSGVFVSESVEVISKFCQEDIIPVAAGRSPATLSCSHFGGCREIFFESPSNGNRGSRVIGATERFGGASSGWENSVDWANERPGNERGKKG